MLEALLHVIWFVAKREPRLVLHYQHYLAPVITENGCHFNKGDPHHFIHLHWQIK